MSGVQGDYRGLPPLLLVSRARMRVLELEYLPSGARGGAGMVVVTVFSGFEPNLECKTAVGAASDGKYTGVMMAHVSNRMLHCGGMFVLDAAEVAPVETWLAKVSA